MGIIQTKTKKSWEFNDTLSSGPEKIGPTNKKQKKMKTHSAPNNKKRKKPSTNKEERPERAPCQPLMMRCTPEGVAKSSRKESGLQPLCWPPTTLMALGPAAKCPCLSET